MNVDDVLTPDAVDVPDRPPARVRRPAPRAPRAPRGAARPAGRRRAARLPRGDGRRARRRLADRAVPGRDRRPSRRDHRPGRPQDGDQRAQLGREGLHGRLRGRELPHLGELHLRPAEPHGCARADDLARHGREAVLVERRGRRALRPPARLASRGAPLRGRRRRDVRLAVRLRPLLPPEPRAQRAVLLPPEARVAPRGEALERRLRLRTGARSASRRGRSRRPS